MHCWQSDLSHRRRFPHHQALDLLEESQHRCHRVVSPKLLPEQSIDLSQTAPEGPCHHLVPSQQHHRPAHHSGPHRCLLQDRRRCDSPPCESRLCEHDQWAGPLQGDTDSDPETALPASPEPAVLKPASVSDVRLVLQELKAANLSTP